MEIPDDIVAGLHAYLVDDSDEAQRLLEPYEAELHPGLGVLVAAVLIVATERKFGETRSQAEIVRYVAQLRTRENPSDIDPFPAEKLLRGALGDAEALEGIADQTKLDTQFTLLDELVTGERIQGHHLHELLARARTRAEQTKLDT